MAFKAIVPKLIVIQKRMRSQGDIINRPSSQVEDVSVGQTDHVLFNPSHSGISLFIFNIFIREDLINRGYDITENVISGNNVRVGCVSIHNDEFVVVLIVP